MSPTELFNVWFCWKKSCSYIFGLQLQNGPVLAINGVLSPGALALEMGKTGGFCSPSG